MSASSLVIVTAAPLLSFSLWVRHQHTKDGKGLRAGLVLGALGSLAAALYASFFWQVYGRDWVMAVPLILGMFLVTVHGVALGKSKWNASFLAMALVGIPVLLMLVTFSAFKGLFQAMHADNSIAELVELPHRVYTLRAKKQRELVIALQSALDYEDIYVRWGAVRALRQCGKEAAPAAGRIARTLLDTKRGGPPSDPAPAEAFQREAVAALRDLGERAKDAGPILQDGLEDPEPAVREEARRILEQLRIDSSAAQRTSFEPRGGK